MASTSDTGKIVGMMAITGIFGVVGAEVRQSRTANAPGAVSHFIADPFLVVAGTTVATAILVALDSFGGTPGRKLGVGLAGLSLLTALLVEGAPVWTVVGKLFSPTARKAATSPPSPTTNKKVPVQ